MNPRKIVRLTRFLKTGLSVLFLGCIFTHLSLLCVFVLAWRLYFHLNTNGTRMYVGTHFPFSVPPPYIRFLCSIRSYFSSVLYFKRPGSAVWWHLYSSIPSFICADVTIVGVLPVSLLIFYLFSLHPPPPLLPSPPPPTPASLPSAFFKARETCPFIIVLPRGLKSLIATSC